MLQFLRYDPAIEFAERKRIILRIVPKVEKTIKDSDVSESEMGPNVLVLMSTFRVLSTRTRVLSSNCHKYSY